MVHTFWEPATVPLVLTKRIYETADTVSFFFSAQDLSHFQFKPGQFVTLKLDIEGKPFARAYSIANLPTKDTLQLTIKRVKAGVVSNWLIDHLQPHDVVWTHGIAGQFNIIDCAKKLKILLISAGCGITPVMSMARYLCNLAEPSQQIRFLHCARDQDNIIFAKEVRKLAKHHKNFKYHWLLESRTTRKDQLKQASYGLIDINKLKHICPEYQDYAIYMCGPAVFMEKVMTMLEAAHYDMQYVFHEDFITNAPQQSNETGKSSPLVQVQVPDFNVNEAVPMGSNLLEVLEGANVPIVGACRSGVCGACKCRITEGQADVGRSILPATDAKQGYVLACVTTVIEDIKVALK